MSVRVSKANSDIRHKAMKIIIAGDGDTGTHIANALSVESQDVVLIGPDREHLAELDAVSNFITVEGNPLSRDLLMQCGADRADLFVAVTPEETVNLVACQIAKDCGVRRCVARIDNPVFDDAENARLFKAGGIDLTIYPEKLAATEIRRFIEHNWASEWIEIHENALIIAGVRMQAAGTICGKMLKEVPSNPRLFHVVAVRRGEVVTIPRGDQRLEEGDTVFFAVTPGNVDLLPGLCGQRGHRVKRIMITGAGNVTENLLETIGRGYNITVIDPDKERCQVIASRFQDVVVVNALANDISTLKEEGIGKCDIFLALTRSSETNIVSCMVAREHGVARTVARVEELQYLPEAESLSIDKIINKKLLNSGKILSVLLDADDSTARCMSLGHIEIADMVAGKGSGIASGCVADLSLPREMTLGGVIRGGRGMLAEGRTEICEGDHVVVFYVPGALNKVSRFFR